MKVFLLLPLVLAIVCCSPKTQQYSGYPISSVSIKDVVLTDSFWLPKIKVIQDTTIRYSFSKCEEEGRMESFLIAGGKKPGPVRGKMPFDDTDLYKIIEGASYSLISNPDPELSAYIDSVISIIKTGQEPDGYLTTWFTINPQQPPATWVKPSTKRWENEISSHELYNSGHLFEAAAAHYWATGKRNFLDIAIKNADLLVANFGADKLRTPPGHQIIETGLIKLYRITNNQKYLELAKFYLDQRGDSIHHKLYGAYNQDHMPVTKQDEVVGHAVRGVYMYAGMTDIAAIYKDSSYLKAVNSLWDNMVNKKMYITGGLGARHEGESFGENYELPNSTAYSETCAAIGSVYWNHRLFMLTGDSKYYDIIERTLYNALIAGISMDGNKFFYPNPLSSDGKYAFNIGACTRQPWFDCSCCPTNLIRFVPSVPSLIYATHKNELYVNLFMSNTAKVTVDGTAVEISQQTAYPWNGKILISINPENKTKFTVKLRVPGWARGEAVPGNLYEYLDKTRGGVIAKVNGETVQYTSGDGYVEITRDWAKGDKIEFGLPMTVKRVVSNSNIKENQGLVAVEYGPLVYCAEAIDNSDKLPQFVIADQSNLKVERRSNLLNGINVITGMASIKEANGNKESNLVMIPYYTWSNRGIGKMNVWFSRGNQ